MQAPAFHVEVIRKAVEAVDICTYELAGIDGKALPPFSAGSHIDVQLPNGAGPREWPSLKTITPTLETS